MRDRSDKPELHNAICDNCSKRCKVPFEPTQGKPIYCSDCYEKLGNKGPRRDDNRRDDRRDDNRRDDNRDNRGPRRDFQADNGMFPAVCDDCGDDCQVPFRPSTDKPIYCSRCFEKRGNGRDMDMNDNRGRDDRGRDRERDENRGRDRDMGERRPPKDPMIEDINTKLNALKDSINTRLNVLEGINTRLSALEELDTKVNQIMALLESKKTTKKEKVVKEPEAKEEVPTVKAKKAPKEKKVQKAPKY